MEKGHLRKQFSTASATLLSKRMPGPEALMEEWISRTPDAELKPVVRFLHDWALHNQERGFYHLGKYFDQSIEEIDSAAELFALKRKELYGQNSKTSSEYKMLQLFLLYDCLIHTGSRSRGETTMAYLDIPASSPPETFGIEQLISDPKRHGKIYNYVMIDGEIKIRSKATHHSEIAMGKDVPAAGEIALVTTSGTLEIMINWKSGHYRPLPASIRKVIRTIHNNGKDHDYTITICADFLLNYRPFAETPQIKQRGLAK